jgi:multicomponent Na+:H+ antiporter subunit B
LKLWPLSLVAAVTLFLLVAGSSLPPLRSLDSPISRTVEPFYVENAIRHMDTPNIVSAILADYRGYDTFGETTVVFAAGLACYLLLRRPL